MDAVDGLLVGFLDAQRGRVFEMLDGVSELGQDEW